MDKDTSFQYCLGIGCPARDRCARYMEGQNLPMGDWTWMNDCGEEHDKFLPMA